MNQAEQIFLTDLKNARSVNIIQGLLNEESPSELAKQYSVTRDAVYKIKEKYIGGNHV